MKKSRQNGEREIEGERENDALVGTLDESVVREIFCLCSKRGEHLIKQQIF